jgi:hypothetical protein
MSVIPSATLPQRRFGKIQMSGTSNETQKQAILLVMTFILSLSSVTNKLTWEICLGAAFLGTLNGSFEFALGPVLFKVFCQVPSHRIGVIVNAY